MTGEPTTEEKAYAETLRDIICDRMGRAKEEGWIFEDSRLTPGIPLWGCRRPDGEVAGVLGYLHLPSPDGMTSFIENMDAVGVPK